MNDKEILKPVIYNGKKIKEYYVTNMGTVYSCYRGGIFDAHTRTILKSHNKNGYLYVTITLENGVSRKCGVHKLVINSFKPLHKYLPPFIDRGDFNKTPKSIQLLLSEVLIVNHIDHDRKNNKLNNLERMTSRQNTMAAVEYRKKNKTSPDPNPDSKMCTICNCSKSITMFHPKRNQCKVCYNLRNKKSHGLKEQEQNKESLKTKVENIVPEIKIVTELRTCKICNFIKNVTLFPGKRKQCKDCTSVYQRNYRDMRKAEKMSKVPIGETESPELIDDYDDMSIFL